MIRKVISFLESKNLTTRQIEAMTYLFFGCETPEVENLLGLSKGGVKFRVSQAFRKLGVKNKYQFQVLVFSHFLPEFTNYIKDPSLIKYQLNIKSSLPIGVK